jgi:hypothetical protein
MDPRRVGSRAPYVAARRRPVDDLQAAPRLALEQRDGVGEEAARSRGV